VLVLLLLAAAAISAVLWMVERDTMLPNDGLAILATVLLNASLGYAQELRAESAVAALRALSPPEATVVRDGARHKVPARELGHVAGLLGTVIALASLYVLDAALPGGFVDGTGDAAHARTMTFTTIVRAQLFNVFAARARRRSAFTDLGTTHRISGAVLVSLLLQAAVVHVPGLQTTFGTAPTGGADWLRCTAAASTVLWVSELVKLSARRSRPAAP
jgi:Ca2+-transporting ATPase